MGDLKVKINSSQFKRFREKLEALSKPIDRATASRVGKEVVAEMRDMMSKGISTIEGEGRFPAYKNPKRYPGKQKPKTPVSLKLTGAMQRGLKYTVSASAAGFATEIYYSAEEAVKEQGHRDGANTQPKRPTIPLRAEGEDYAQRIKKVIADIYKERLKSITI